VKVLITGGAGFIGSHLSEALVEAGHQVTVFDNLHPQTHAYSRFPAYLTSNVDFIFGDVRNRDLLKQAVEHADVVYHLAALTGVGQSMYQVADYVDVNVGGTATLLDILVHESNHVRRLILASSRAIYGEGAYECKSCGAVPVVVRDTSLLAAGKWDPPCPCCGAALHPQPTSEKWQPHPSSVYATTKLSQEYLALSVGRAYGIEVVVLRYFNVYGPRQSLSNPYTGILSIFLNQLKTGEIVEVYEDGLESRDFVHVSDVVQANLLALNCDRASGEVINIGSGKPVSVLKVAEILGGLAGRPQAFYVSGRYRVGDIRHCFADIQKAEKLLRYAPCKSLAEGILDFVNWASHETAANQTRLAEDELTARNLLRKGT